VLLGKKTKTLLRVQSEIKLPVSIAEYAQEHQKAMMVKDK